MTVGWGIGFGIAAVGLSILEITKGECKSNLYSLEMIYILDVTAVAPE
jgi:hypothetical protein